jgi:hypothetical protein
MSRSIRCAVFVSVVAGLALLSAPAQAKGKKKKGAASPRKSDGSALPAPTPTGMIQSFFTLWDQDVDPITDPAGYGDPEDDFGFKLRRARIGLVAKDDQVKYDITMGFTSGFDAVDPPASGSIQIITAEGSYKPAKGFWLTGGVQKVPVSRDFLMSASQLASGDRAVGSVRMVPGRDLGITADYGTGDPDGDGFKARIRAGMYNGNGDLFGDDNPGKLVATRVDLVFGPGNVYRTWGRVKGATIGLAGDYWSNNDLGAQETGFGADAIFRIEGLALLSELTMATIEPQNADIVMPSLLEDTRRMGMSHQLGYSVWMVEPYVRYTTFDDNRNFDDNGDVAELQGGVTWHGGDDAVRAGLAFLHRMEPSGVETDNDTARLWMQLAF